MSTKQSTTQNDTETRFVAVGPPERFDAETIEAMAAPEAGAGAPFYAVARRTGTLHDGDGADGTTEAIAVLFLSRDGRAVERWIPARLGLERLPRAIRPGCDVAKPAEDETLAAYGDVIARHPAGGD